jgi:PHD/YefM family antitoxin component YafN of YafNO toxin-antitoxin module
METAQITTFQSSEFNLKVAEAIAATADGPVFVVDHERPTHVLLTIESYRRLTGNIADMLAMPEAADIEFDPPKLQGPLWRSADFD